MHTHIICVGGRLRQEASPEVLQNFMICWANTFGQSLLMRCVLHLHESGLTFCTVSVLLEVERWKDID